MMPSPASAPLSAIVLAAGMSRRSAPANKLLQPASDGSGRLVVRAVVDALAATNCAELIVVVGHEHEKIEAALHDRPVRFVFAADYAHGMGHSLAAGIRAANAGAAGFAVVPGDLPYLSRALIATIVACFISERAEHHVIPMVQGERGHPVILGAWLRPALERLEGDAGARHLLAGPAEFARCCFLEVGDRAILRDVDEGTESNS